MALLNINKKNGDTFTAAEVNKIASAIDKNTVDVQRLMEGETMMYGVEFDTNISNPACTRIGNLAFHRSLPIHNRMRGCLLNDNGEVVEYLDPQSWLNNVLDGSRGQVMVELPEHYRRFETEGTKRRVKLSDYPLPGYHLVPKMYVSAYEASIQRSTGKLSSVKNKTIDYRGGSNNASWDAAPNTLLGRPVTSMSRSAFRTAARKRKSSSTEWNLMTYEIQKELYWLFVVEYATLNTQAAFNAAKDSNGFMQGGLGAGVTNATGGDWEKFSSYNPFVPCGFTDALGNKSGEMAYSVTSTDKTITLNVKVPRYRGIENPFGHIHQHTDGLQLRMAPKTNSSGLTEVFVCNDPSKFNDSNYTGYSHVGNSVRAEGYIKSVIFGEGGEIVPGAIDGSASTYHCDYIGLSLPAANTEMRVVLFGGPAHYSSSAGFVCAYASNGPSDSNAHIGSRLCFVPKR